jgi:DNA-binding NtrC family response regulator
MAAVETETDTYRDHQAAGARSSDVLYVAFHGHEPSRLPSRHVLDDIDVIELGHGRDRVTRDRKDGARRLHIQVSDKLVSKQHCQLVRARGSMVLRDLGSKNGTLVGGIRTEQCEFAFDQVFTVGHVLCFVRREPARDDGAPDLDGSQLRRPVPGQRTFDPAFGAALERVAQVAASPILSILILGEAGVGKDRIASAIHELSRQPGRYVAVNCGGIAPSLVEAELFGHRRGAFTDARDERLGYFRTADRGTIFLDEIGDLPRATQASLLRALENQEIMPVGDSIPVKVDLRVCSATNRDLEEMVAAGAFRKDLWDRISGFTIAVPALRVRRADLGMLIATLLESKREAPRFTPQTATRLFQYPWPGNVRELRSALELMVAMAAGRPISLEHLPDAIRDYRHSAAVSPARPATPKARAPLSPEQREKKAWLEQLLRECGTKAEVARRIGKDRKQVYRMIEDLGIEDTGDDLG